MFREWIVGTGKDVLDLGCRDGALTRAYIDGNEVVGVDVDREALAEAAKLGIETVWAERRTSRCRFADAELRRRRRRRAARAPAGCPERTIGRGAARAAAGRAPRRLGAERLPAEESALRFLLRAGARTGDPDAPPPLRPGATCSAPRAGSSRTELRFVAGRLTRLHPRLFANDIVFRAQKPA